MTIRLAGEHSQADLLADQNYLQTSWQRTPFAKRSGFGHLRQNSLEHYWNYLLASSMCLAAVHSLAPYRQHLNCFPLSATQAPMNFPLELGLWRLDSTKYCLAANSKAGPEPPMESEHYKLPVTAESDLEQTHRCILDCRTGDSGILL